MLSDNNIRAMLDSGEIVIDPLPKDESIQPASIDLHLGSSFIQITASGDIPSRLEPEHSLSLYPGECFLGTTVETITVPPSVVARVEGKSSLGRLFLMVHSTAGFIDPGFTGEITLELKNMSPRIIQLDVGQPIAQISFQLLDTPADRPYGTAGLGSHYQHQRGATASRL